VGWALADSSVLQKTAPRSLTPAVSRIVLNEGLAGIRYLSKHGHDMENWALFEHFQILTLQPRSMEPRSMEPRSIRRDDPGLEPAKTRRRQVRLASGVIDADSRLLEDHCFVSVKEHAILEMPTDAPRKNQFFQVPALLQ
jgi:hypothetical protein